MLQMLLIMAWLMALQQLRRKAHLLQKACKVEMAMGQGKSCRGIHVLLLLQVPCETSGGCVVAYLPGLCAAAQPAPAALLHSAALTAGLP